MELQYGVINMHIVCRWNHILFSCHTFLLQQDLVDGKYCVCKGDITCLMCIACLDNIMCNEELHNVCISHQNVATNIRIFVKS